MHFDGQSWSEVTFSTGTKSSSRVVVNAVDDVFLLSGRKVFHYDGIDWTETEPVSWTPTDIWAESWSNIYLSGHVNDSDVGLYHYNGTTWTAYADPSSTLGTRLNALWGASGKDVFAVGLSGKIIRYNMP
jgi:hypothetical protein